MSEPPDLRDLVGDGIPPDEMARLREVDALLRSVPAPPVRVGDEVERRILRRPARRRPAPRRVMAGLALAAAVVALAFFAGALVTRGGGFNATRTIDLRATAAAPSGAGGVVRLGSRDRHGNLPIELDVAGLPPLPGGYYTLGLARPGRGMVTCGTFQMGPGTTTARMTISYEVSEYSGWVVVARADGQRPEGGRPRALLVGRTGDGGSG